MGRACGKQAVVLVSLAALWMMGSAVAQSAAKCGQAGTPCCCKANDWQNPRCCDSGSQCTMFAGQGFGTLPTVESLCVPKATAASTQAKTCETEGSACCISTDDNGYAAASCGSGLVCTASSIGWASKGQYSRLATGFAAAAKDTAVMGTCRKFTAADCGKAYMPCGKDIAAAGVTCPGSVTSCPSGFYCAAAYDAGVGERCIPVPKDAGKPGGPCLPNNMLGAPVVKFTGVELAPAFCTGAAVCFTGVAGDTTGFTHSKPQEAKSLASRISGTQCINVPSDCGSAPGKPCCPSNYGVVTDKPLPSQNTKWVGAPCSSEASKYGMYCSGSYVALASQPMGTCVANPECGNENQPCCKYSKPDMGGVSCPGFASGKGYCTLTYKCRLCPNPLWLMEDIFRCY